MTRLGAFDALSRGIANVRANPRLVVVSLLGSATVLAVVLLSLIPAIAAVGVDLDAASLRGALDPMRWQNGFSALFDPGGFLRRIAVGGVIFSLGLTLASFVYCWYWGGVLGVLCAADAQAPPGAGREPLLFATWSGRLFVAESQRLAWRVLLFWTLMLTLMLGVLALFGAALVGAAWIWSRESAGAGFAVACGAMIPLVFLYVAISLATWLGQVELARGETGALAAARVGFGMLGRRLGAAVGLLALYVLVVVTMGVAFGFAGVLTDLVLQSVPSLAFMIDIGRVVVQWALSTLLTLVFTATGIALVRSEQALDSLPAA